MPDANQPATATSSPGPVGQGDYEVRAGDCMSSIAKDHGYFWQTIWDDPANAELKNTRKDPNVLLPKDRVTLPPKNQKQEPGQTELRHRFMVKGQPEKLRVRILRDGKPRKNQPYTLEVNGSVYRGNTDPAGKIECPIPPNARRAKLEVGTPPDVDQYDLNLGEIDPIDQVSGIQGRLSSLGFDCGAVDGLWGPRTEQALRAYQKHCGFEVTGEMDERTRQRLQQDYGC